MDICECITDSPCCTVKLTQHCKSTVLHKVKNKQENIREWTFDYHRGRGGKDSYRFGDRHVYVAI